jgi:hypothetical protein
MHTSITGGIVGGGKSKRIEAAAWLEMERKGGLLAQNNKDANIRVANQVARSMRRKSPRKTRNSIPTRSGTNAIAKGGVTPGLSPSPRPTFLFESGQFKHAAEFLKANLRHGVVVRPWVFEALAVALEAAARRPREIRRARLSGIALDPTDAQGFMSAARAMADRGQHDRALAFCRQAALLEPNDYHPYEVA